MMLLLNVLFESPKETGSIFLTASLAASAFLVSVIVNCFGSLHEDHQKPGGSTDNYTGEKFKLYTSLIVRSIHSKILHDLVPEKMWLYFIHK